MVEYKKKLKKKAVEKIRDSEGTFLVEELWLAMAPSQEELEDVLDEIRKESSESDRLSSLGPVPKCLDLSCVPPQLIGDLPEEFSAKQRNVSGEAQYATEESLNRLERTCGFWGVQAKLVLEKAIQTLEESEDVVSAENIAKLLFDVDGFRLKKVSELKGPLISFWKHTYPKTSKLVSYMLACRLLAPIVSKMERDVIETRRAFELEDLSLRPGVKGAVRLLEHKKKLEKLKPIAEEMGMLVPQRVDILAERFEKLESKEGS